VSGAHVAARDTDHRACESTDSTGVKYSTTDIIVGNVMAIRHLSRALTNTHTRLISALFTVAGEAVFKGRSSIVYTNRLVHGAMDGAPWSVGLNFKCQQIYFSVRRSLQFLISVSLIESSLAWNQNASVIICYQTLRQILLCGKYSESNSRTCCLLACLFSPDYILFWFSIFNCAAELHTRVVLLLRTYSYFLSKVSYDSIFVIQRCPWFCQKVATDGDQTKIATKKIRLYCIPLCVFNESGSFSSFHTTFILFIYLY